MSFEAGKEYRMGDVITSANTGLDAIKRAPIVNYDSGVKCLRIQDISQSKNFSDWGFCDVNEKNFQSFKLLKDDIIVARTGETVGVNQIIPNNLKSVYNNGLIRLRADNNKVDNKFLYFNLQSQHFKNHIDSVARGSSTQPNLRIEALLDFKINLPALTIQRRIASILSSLDDKIELNRQTNQTLEAIVQALFKEWFVDFNFPGATGEMQDSELGEIPKGWTVGKLGDVIINFDSKRIPLSGREREKRKGIYPYYGATSIVDYVDDFLFDGVYLLMGEDGTVITEDEKPVLQYVSGKFWVNNHTHVLKGKDFFSTEYVYSQLRNTNVKHLVTGAVQPKINQGNMNGLKILIPDKKVVTVFSNIVKPIFENILNSERQTKTLTQLRDSLLPKLMNGEIKL